VNGNCDCTTPTNCGCCVTSIPLINDICANLTWKENLAAIDVDLIVANSIVWQGEVTGPDGIEVCTQGSCAVCLAVYDVNIVTTGACGDVAVNASCFGLNFEWNLGSVR
jgi:hypothetical protein